jgi:type I restriction enzyme M protein
VAEARAAINNHAGLIWAIADLLRGDYKRAEYQKVILPLVLLRRLDCVLEPTKDQVLARAKTLESENARNVVLKTITGVEAYNTSPLTLRRILADPPQVAGNLRAWIALFDPETRDVIEKFDFDAQIGRLDRAKLLYLVLSKVTEVDLHPDKVSNVEMGYIYEELLRKFSELSNETAGEHFTPREVIRLMVDLLFIEDDDILRTPGTVRTMLDPACGTGGMLSVAQEYLRELNPTAQLIGYGQELNAETYALCRADMMLKGQKATNIALGNSFSEDAFPGERYDYLLANPPFGVEWKKVQDVVEAEHEKLSFAGRFGAGTPRINDGSFLFLQHMISKLRRPEEGGGRLAIVFNGSPMAVGDAGSGESEIRRWIVENDWLEGIVALPDQLFYNTPISTYFWIVTNRKRPERRGKVQLVDARESFVKMRRSLGSKRNEVSPEQTAELARLYGDFEEGERVKILPNESLGYQRITVERPLRLRYEVTSETLPAIETSPGRTKLTEPERIALVLLIGRLAGLSTTDRTAAAREIGFPPKIIERAVWDAISVRDPEAPVATDKKGRPEPDPDLRDNENVPLVGPTLGYEADPSERLASAAYRSAVASYVAAEVLPYLSDAWVDHSKTRMGYEIPVPRYFYTYGGPRYLGEIDADIGETTAQIQSLLESRESGRQRSATLPTNWTMTRLDRIATVRARIGWKALTADEYVSDGYVFLATPNIKGNEIDFDNVNYITEFRYCESPELQLRVGDVLLAKDGATLGITNVVLDLPQPATVNGSIAVIRPTDIDSRYLRYVLASDFIQGMIGTFKGGMGVPHLFQADLRKFPIPKPPRHEQIAIANFLDQETEGIDALSSIIGATGSASPGTLAGLLQERRQALITAAVTGQIEIPGVAA